MEASGFKTSTSLLSYDFSKLQHFQYLASEYWREPLYLKFDYLIALLVKITLSLKIYCFYPTHSFESTPGCLPTSYETLCILKDCQQIKSNWPINGISKHYSNIILLIVLRLLGK